MADNFARWLAGRKGERPAFVFINFLEAHFPYHQVPREFLARYTHASQQELRKFSLETFGATFGRTLTSGEMAAAIGPTTDMYDAGVRYSDHLLESVVERIRASGRLDETVLVVLADHGEMLGEQGLFGHGASVSQSDLHVPLVIRYPHTIAAGSRVEAPISTVGVYATVLDLLNIDSPGPLQVGSLLPSISGETIDAPILSERYISAMQPPGKNVPMADNLRYRVYRSGDYKLIVEHDGDLDVFSLFNLAEDPNELVDLAAREPQVLTRVQAELRDWQKRLGLPDLGAPIDAAAEMEMDPATRDQLKALGYLE